ncbi:MAG TPA: GPW/gp25 family protein [Chryseolinea sp.]
MSEDHSFLGTGWSFPPTFDNTSAQVAMLSGEDDIESSLQILLSTALGERIMQPKFGCNLSDMVFENLDVTLQTEMKNRIEKAILFYEPRVDLEGIALTPDETGGLIIIDVRYIVRATNTRGNLVYPFYLTEV